MEKLKGLLVGVVLVLALGAGKVMLKVMPVAGGAALGSAIMGQLRTDEISELKAGFREVSPDIERWMRMWNDSTVAAGHRWSARVAVEYTTEAEVLEIYRFRSERFAQVAHDPSLNAACGGNATDDMLKGLNATPIMRTIGRGFARRHEGHAPWVPPVDLETDERAWNGFADYLSQNGLEDVLDMMLGYADGTTLSNPFVCNTISDLYRVVVRRPDQPVGGVRLVDFVRALDLYGARALPAQ